MQAVSIRNFVLKMYKVYVFLLDLESILNSPALKQSPDLINFSNLVVSQIPAKWRLFGAQLGFSNDEMDCIVDDCQGANQTKLRFTSIFDKWKKRGSRNIREFTWCTVVMILSTQFLSEPEVANSIYNFCHEDYRPLTPNENTCFKRVWYFIRGLCSRSTD